MTERLTTNKGQCVACIGCIEESNCKVECGAIDDCLEKLTEYETAEEDGRLVVLPCNVGDPVYVLRQSWNGWNIDKKKFTYGMMRYAQERPDEVKLKSDNKDGSAFFHVPVSYIKCSPPRKVSEAQREAAGERFRKMWEEKREMEEDQ